MKKKSFLLILFLVLSLSLFGGCKIGNDFFNDGNDTPTVSEKDQKYEVYLMAVEEGLTSLTYEEWLDTIKGEIGPEGPAGKKLLLNISSTHIQYKYEGDLTWTNLISLDKLKGEDGTDGREVEFRKTDTSIEWRYKATDSWEHLIYLSEITGEKGDDGRTWYIEAGEPTSFVASESSYKRNDLYLDTKTGIVYRCVIYSNNDKGDWWKEIELVKKEKITVNFDANLPAYMYEFDNYIENNKKLKETTIDKGSWLQLETFKNTKLKEYFLGWYIGEGVDETKITSYTSINEDCTLTAKWDYEKIDETFTNSCVVLNSLYSDSYYAQLNSYCGDVVHIAKTYNGKPIKSVEYLYKATNTSEILLPGSADISYYGVTNINSLIEKQPENTSLKKVSWYGEMTVTKIGSQAFFNCTALTDIDIPETITRIGTYAFYNCISLEGLSLENIETIGDYAFYNCSALNNSKWLSWGFWLPESLKSIGDNAFEGCTSLNTIYINSDEIANLEDNSSYLFSYADTINIKNSITTETTAYLDETQGHFTGTRYASSGTHYKITKVKEN